MARWDIITGEYPPQPGGVSDYTRLVACGLAAAGDNVRVWAPPSPSPDWVDAGLKVHRLPDHFGPRALVRLNRTIGSDGARVLVQYAPHAFGLKGMNLPFCAWLYAQRRRLPIEVMFHEVAYPIIPGQPLRHRILALAQRMMATLAARSANSIFVATPLWEAPLRKVIRGDRVPVWLPIPSNIERVDDAVSVASTRMRYAPAGGPLVGHFGTYGPAIRSALAVTLPAILAGRSDAVAVLMGRNGESFRDDLMRRNPMLRGRVHATGGLEAAEVSHLVAACDIMIQPYPEGITTRRTSAMAGLLHARPTVTTSGVLTEPLWREAGAVALVPAGDFDALAETAVRLLADKAALTCLGEAGRRLYLSRFELRHTIAALRSSGCVSR